MTIRGINHYYPANLINAYLDSEHSSIHAFIINFFHAHQVPAIQLKFPKMGEDPVLFLKQVSLLINDTFRSMGRDSLRTHEALTIFYDFMGHIVKGPSHEIFELLNHVNKRADLKKLLAAIFFDIHFQDSELLILAIQSGQPRHLMAYLCQKIAEHCDEEAIQGILKHLSFNHKVSLIVELHQNYREGSYYALKALEELAVVDIRLKRGVLENRELLQLLRGLKAHLYSCSTIVQMMGNTLREFSLSRLRQVNECQNSVLEHEADLLVEELNKGIVFFKAVTKKSPEHFQVAAEYLKPFLSTHVIKTKAFELIHLFGLYDHQCIFPDSHAHKTLPQKLRAVLRKVMNKELKSGYENSVHYLARFFSLYAAILNNEYFRRGLRKMAFGIPTCGKDLSRLPVVSSLLKSLQLIPPRRTLDQVPEVVRIFGYALGKIQCIVEEYTLETHVMPFEMRDIPIVIFDQSSQEMFQKNRKYLKKMNDTFEASLIHCSKEDAVQLARKIKVEHLIVTNGDQFGFGGARNAVFLLAPVIAEAVRRGIDINTSDEAVLRKIFKQKVLKISGEDAFVHMIDDDIEVRRSALFPNIVFAAQHTEYAAHTNITLGRDTTKIASPFMIGRVVPDPKYVYATTNWSDDHSFQMMSSVTMSKPRFCLNLPFGNEEGQDIFIHEYTFQYARDVRTSYFHLPGRRFLLDKIPASPYTNVTTFLKRSIPASFSPVIIESLVYGNKKGLATQAILPWHKDPHDFTKVKSLHEIFKFVADHGRELQFNFWLKMFELWSVPDSSQSQDYLIITLESFLTQDFHALAEGLQAQYPILQEELERLRNLYLDFKEEVQIFCGFGNTMLDLIQERTRSFLGEDFSQKEMVICALENGIDFSECVEIAREGLEKTTSKPIEAFPMIHTLYLVAKSLGCNGFVNAVRNAISP